MIILFENSRLLPITPRKLNVKLWANMAAGDVTEVLPLPSIRRRTLRSKILQNGRRQSQCTVGNKEPFHTDRY
jgi:hypothetical protein